MSIKQSVFEQITLESNDFQRTIDITPGVTEVRYYEDLFSPTITATIRVVSTAGAIVGRESKDTQRQSVYHGLPLVGGERVALKIASNSTTNPGLDFLTSPKDYLYVSSISNAIIENNKESFTLNLVSREAIANETTRVSKKYSFPTIDQSVSSILSSVLKTEKQLTIDKTSNKYNFIGNMRKPFTVLTWLASKSVPESSGSPTAGFFFYQTKDGFNFRSIDALLNKEKNPPRYAYYYNESNESYTVDGKKVDNDFKILNYNIERNQNLIEKLRLGTYASHRMFFNPLTFNFTRPEDGVFKKDDYITKVENLGKQEFKLPILAEGSDKTLGDVPTRIITAVYDVGTLEVGVSTAINSDQTQYQSQSLMRYNNLFTHMLNVMIPSNTNLKAGDVIECYFPKITRSDAREYDEEQSGLYMIKEICHYFDATRSYTSLKLIRDTYGVR